MFASLPVDATNVRCACDDSADGGDKQTACCRLARSASRGTAVTLRDRSLSRIYRRNVLSRPIMVMSMYSDPS